MREQLWKANDLSREAYEAFRAGNSADAIDLYEQSALIFDQLQGYEYEAMCTRRTAAAVRDATPGCQMCLFLRVKCGEHQEEVARGNSAA